MYVKGRGKGKANHCRTRLSNCTGYTELVIRTGGILKRKDWTEPYPLVRTSRKKKLDKADLFQLRINHDRKKRRGTR